MTILEDVQAVQETVVKGDACKKQNAARKAQCAGRVIVPQMASVRKAVRMARPMVRPHQEIIKAMRMMGNGSDGYQDDISVTEGEP